MSNEKIDLSLFDDEERQFINALSAGAAYQVDRDTILRLSRNARSVAGEEDTDSCNLADTVISKLTQISDGEWDGLKALLPFPTVISADEDFSFAEVPDEEYL